MKNAQTSDETHEKFLMPSRKIGENMINENKRTGNVAL